MLCQLSPTYCFLLHIPSTDCIESCYSPWQSVTNFCQESVAIQRMTLFVFGEAGILYVTPLSGQKETKHPLCLHPPSFSFLLSFPLSTLPHVSWLSSSLCSSFSLTDFSSFGRLFFCVCVCTRVCVCNGSIVPTAARGITEVRLPTYESNSANRALRWHNTHAHTMSIPQPPIIHS